MDRTVFAEAQSMQDSQEDSCVAQRNALRKE